MAPGSGTDDGWVFWPDAEASKLLKASAKRENRWKKDFMSARDEYRVGNWL
jgi:hypothetical protein